MSEENNNNVVRFPRPKQRIKDKLRKQILNLTEQKIDDKINHLHAYHINETVDFVVPMLLNQIELAGFPMIYEDEPDFNILSGAFITEAVRAMLCRHYNIFHPFQRLSDAVFTADEEGYINMANTINVDLTSPEDCAIVYSDDFPLDIDDEEDY